MSKKLATIITIVPIQFHEEDYKEKPFNKAKLIELFTEMKFKTLGKRVLGDDLPVFTTAPQAVQTDLFGAPVATANSSKGKPLVAANETAVTETFGLQNSQTVQHTYHLIQTPA
jgi:DNA polymerase-1